MNFISLIIIVLGFGVIVAIHELGHFLVARFFDVGIKKYSIGFGKPLLRYQKGETEYLLSLIPLGGYVKMQGDNPEEDLDEGQDPSRSFLNKAWWQKALIVFAGPFANLILGMMLFSFSMALPQKQDDLAPVIHSAQGIWTEVFAPGDSLISINGKPVLGFNEFLLELYHSENADISYQRGAEPLLLQVASAEKDSLISSLQPMAKAIIGEVFTGLPAWKAGLEAGDEILSVDSVAVKDWYDMRQKIVQAPADKVNLGLKRGDKEFSRTIELQDNLSGEADSRMIGIRQYMPISHSIRYSPKEAVVMGVASTFGFIKMQYEALFRLSKKPKELKNNLGGPVILATMSQEMGRRGLSSLVLFLASISLILMIMNLLPIPVLDGGHIMFYIIEGIIRRPVPPKVQAFLQSIGLVLLIALMIFAFFNDLSKLAYRLLFSR